MPIGVYKHQIRTAESKKKQSETLKRIGAGKWNIGRKRSDEFKKKISLTTKGKSNTGSFKKGQISPNKGKKCPWVKNNPQIFGLGHLPWNTGKHRPEISGENNHLWKGGITPENLRIRGSLEYKLWRTAVFERDGYTCLMCGDNKGGNLNAHHIKPFYLYPELRMAIDNGITLCEKCHIKIHKLII